MPAVVPDPITPLAQTRAEADYRHDPGTHYVDGADPDSLWAGPADGSVRSSRVLMVLGAALVVVLLGAGAAYLYDRSTTAGADPVLAQPVDPGASAWGGSAPTAYPSEPAPTTTSESPAAALTSIASADRSDVTALQGLWVPQLSAKQDGMTIDGVVWDDARILEHAQSLRARYPDALLLNSSDYASFRSPGFWVVVGGSGYTTADAANSWCDQQGIGTDDCFAKRISQDGSGRNTVPR